MAIDYGLKRCGLAATDPLQIIVSPLDTVATVDLEEYIISYLGTEEVEELVFGWPTHKDGNPTHITGDILNFKKKLQKQFPSLKYSFADESFSSVQAKEIIFKSGVNKKKRRDKALVDKISAVIILQRFLNHI